MAKLPFRAALELALFTLIMRRDYFSLRGKVKRLLGASLAGAIALAGVWLVLRAAAPTAAQSPPASGYSPAAPTLSVNYPNCRFGIGGNVNGFDVAALNVGWHMDWSTQLVPPHPNGAEYVQVVRLQPDFGGYTFSPLTATLFSIIDNNPGAIWIVGNEPDSPFQDRLGPEVYARAYHHLYYLIKQRDPSARVGSAGIVQPTPLRFEYLDRALRAYLQWYGEPLPTEFWNIHSYILREIDASDPEAYPNGPYEVWGAFVPPGITATRGLLYTYSDMFRLDIFEQRLVDFRRWMRDRGYRDMPLYITEYGTLFPYPPYITPPPYEDENGVYMTENRTAAFMTGAFDILLNQSDAAIGYPADGNRLVQRWLWYSVSDPGYGGLLFDPDSHARRPLGDIFYTYTHALSPSLDLLAVRALAEPAAISYTGQLETTTLKGLVSNAGNISAGLPITVAFYSGQPPGGELIGARVITSGLPGCAGTSLVSIAWPNLGPGAHPMYIRVDPDNAVAEANEANNIASGVALIATHRAFLPLVTQALAWP